MKKKPVLRFESVKPFYPDIVVPSKLTVPKWYKDEKNPGHFISTFKKCVPFLETMTTGYTVLLPVDLLVKQRPDGPYIEWRQAPDERMVGFKLNESIDRIPTPKGYHKDSFYWHFPVSFQVPVGYSVLITNPLNRFDLPFHTLSAVMDGGYTLAPNAFIAFFLQEGFEGLIPQGTPIAQLIPYKNQAWSAEKTEGILEEGELNRLKSDSVYTGWYKKTWWTKKDYT